MYHNIGLSITSNIAFNVGSQSSIDGGGSALDLLLYGDDNQLWLDASDTSTVTQSSGSVSQWNDKSGNGNNATQGIGTAQFTYNAMGLNSKPAMISASGDSMSLPEIISLTNDYSIFIVNLRAQFFPMMLLGKNDETSKIGFITTDTGRAFVRTLNAGSGDNSQNFPSADVANIYEVTRDTSNKVDLTFSGASFNRIYANVAQVGDTNINIIGGDIDANSWRGAISEIIIFNRKLTSGERELINNYLSNKWGI